MAMEFSIGKDTPEGEPTRKPSASTAPKSAGRKPGRPPGTTTQKRDNVAAALSTMESAYSAMSMGVLMLGKPLTAEMIAVRTEQWQASNRQAFEASARLAAAIAGVGQTSGVLMFAATNIVAVGSIVMTLRQETALQAAENAERNTTENE